MEPIRDKPFLIGICGGSASGKTSVANVIFKYVGIQHCLLFSMDSYYKGPTDEERKNLSEYNFDHPDALDLDLLSKHLAMLINNQPIDMPIYSFNGSRRLKETTRVEPNKLIIFEGILTFHDKRMRDIMDMKIFVDLDADIRIARRVYRDIKDRGRGLDTIIERYHKFVKPAFEGFIKPTRKFADVIIPRGAENTQAIDLISQHLKFGLVKLFNNKQIEVIPQPVKEKVIALEELFPKELKNEKLTISKIKDQIKLHKVFIDYINGKKTAYHKMYLDYMLKQLLELKDNKNTYDAIILQSELNRESIGNLTAKKLLVFAPIMMTHEEVIEMNMKELLDKEGIECITVMSIFMSQEVYESVRKCNNVKVDFISLYFGNQLKLYEKYLLNGGFIGDDYEGEYTNELVIFSQNNIERQFKLIQL